MIVCVERPAAEGHLLAQTLQSGLADLGAKCEVLRVSSVIELLGERGPANPDGIAARVSVLGPFVEDALRFTDREKGNVPVILIGTEDERATVQRALVGREHVRFCLEGELSSKLPEWLSVTIELRDLRRFRQMHVSVANELRRARKQIVFGEAPPGAVPRGPPCGPTLPTSVEEVLPLREARASFERGVVKAAVREAGSLKDAADLLGISYTSLWRRMRY